jgi:hypothetical protein
VAGFKRLELVWPNWENQLRSIKPLMYEGNWFCDVEPNRQLDDGTTLIISHYP